MSQLTDHVNRNILFEVFPSGFGAHNDTESALVKVIDDLLMVGPWTCIHTCSTVLLDLSAAFDTVDCGILLQRLQHEIKITGTALNGFISYLDRFNFVHVNGAFSECTKVHHGVPQGSVLGSLFTCALSEILFRDMAYIFIVTPMIHTIIFYICLSSFWVAGVFWSLSQLSRGAR